MAKFLSVSARTVIARVLDPVAGALLRAGVSPNAVTVAGTVGVLVGAVGFAARGEILIAVIVVTLFGFTDLIDGAMARLSGRTTRFGALLDSTMDRLADGAIFASLAYWLATSHRPWAATAALICLVAGQLVSYVKARAEGLGLSADVGLAERAERLIIIGLGGLASVFIWPYAMDVALWLLAALSVITVGQRLASAYRSGAPAAVRPEVRQ